MKFGGKSFHSLNHFFKNKFGCKVIKISIDGGFTCPNRDGSLSSKGCIFCSKEGSSEFAFSKLSITEQFEKYKEFISSKWKNAKYMPYFQAYTNTYDTVENLRKKYEEVLNLPEIVGISIATRPDCLDKDVLNLLEEISKKTFLMVELGFQTSNEKSIKFINRCYENDVYLEAVKNLKNIGANVVTHVILGLPHETPEDMKNTVDYAINAGTNGIKLHLLYILKNTVLGDMYESGEFMTLEFEEYINLVIDIIEKVPKDVVIHRLTGDAKRDELLAPMYTIKKFHILNAIDEEFKKRNSYQGKWRSS
ncbi:MAG: TIGR01212 family radical SAM protein [Defluviitaleaceae bacterium]|nr:TIGR01212 family radical SAM protein [Defluviitaleaceae bacterium]